MFSAYRISEFVKVTIENDMKRLTAPDALEIKSGKGLS